MYTRIVMVIAISAHASRIMSAGAKVRTGKEVIEALLSADTPAKKSRATKLKNEYVAQRVAEGKDAKKVLAGVLSRVSRLSGGAAKTSPTAKTTAKAKRKPAGAK